MASFTANRWGQPISNWVPRPSSQQSASVAPTNSWLEAKVQYLQALPKENRWKRGVSYDFMGFHWAYGGLMGFLMVKMDTKNVFQSPIWQGLSWGWYFNPEKNNWIRQQSPWGGSMCFHQFGTGLAQSLISLTKYPQLCLLYSLSIPIPWAFLLPSIHVVI